MVERQAVMDRRHWQHRAALRGALDPGVGSVWHEERHNGSSGAVDPGDGCSGSLLMAPAAAAWRIHASYALNSGNKAVTVLYNTSQDLCILYP
jgi:hypothetical protein